MGLSTDDSSAYSPDRHAVVPYHISGYSTVASGVQGLLLFMCKPCVNYDVQLPRRTRVDVVEASSLPLFRALYRPPVAESEQHFSCYQTGETVNVRTTNLQREFRPYIVVVSSLVGQSPNCNRRLNCGWYSKYSTAIVQRVMFRSLPAHSIFFQQEKRCVSLHVSCA